MTPKGQATKAQLNKGEHITLKLCTANERIHRVRRPPTQSENMFADHLNRLFPKEDTNGQHVSMKKYLTPLVIREIQI